MGDEDVDDHEDFASSHGAQLQDFALQLSGDSVVAVELVDGALADVWADRHRVASSDWPAHARERVARRWAARQDWPVPTTSSEELAGSDTDDLRTTGRALARRRALVAAASVGSLAVLGAVGQALRRAAAGRRVRLGDTVVEVATPMIDGDTVVQVSHDGELMAEFRETRDRPLIAITPLPDGRELVAAWLRPEVSVVDVANVGANPVSPTTLLPLVRGTLALTIGRSSGRVPELTYLTPAGYRTEPPSVTQAVIDWGRLKVTGYFAPRLGVFVLQSPRRQVVQGRHESEASIFLADLGDNAQLVVVHTWSLVAATIRRSDRWVATERQIFQSGALVCGVVEPPASAANPVEITVSTADGTKTIRVEG